MEAIPMPCLSWDAWACELSAYLSTSFVSHGANVCHPGGGRVLADRLMLGSTSPGPSAISFSHVWEKSVSSEAGSLSLPPPPSLYPFLKDLGLFTILGPAGAIPTIPTAARAPQSEGSTGSAFNPTPLDLLWVTPQTLYPSLTTQTDQTTQQNLWACVCLFI